MAVGVPVVAIRGGPNYVGRPPGWGAAQHEAFERTDYHQVTDETQYIDYDRMARVAQYIADLATKVANNDQRPVVDKTKPDPHGQCVQ